MHCVYLGESFPTSIYWLLANVGFDTAENEPCKVCPLSAYRSPRLPDLLVHDAENDDIMAWLILDYIHEQAGGQSGVYDPGGR